VAEDAAARTSRLAQVAVKGSKRQTEGGSGARAVMQKGVEAVVDAEKRKWVCV
jgi:hypothetical protein